LLTFLSLVIERQNIFLRINIMFGIHFSIENRCDYHQNHVFNASQSAEQTLIGRIYFRNNLFNIQL